jgi:hypothetical protein
MQMLPDNILAARRPRRSSSRKTVWTAITQSSLASSSGTRSSTGTTDTYTGADLRPGTAGQTKKTDGSANSKTLRKDDTSVGEEFIRFAVNKKARY